MNIIRKIKRKYILISLLFSCSCAHFCQNPNAKSDIVYSNQLILGAKWSLCEVKYKDNITKMNICPGIIFNTKGQGIFVNTSNEESQFNWKITSDSLLSIFNVENDLILNGVYSIDTNQEGNFTEMKLYNTDKDVTYFLRK